METCRLWKASFQVPFIFRLGECCLSGAEFTGSTSCRLNGLQIEDSAPIGWFLAACPVFKPGREAFWWCDMKTWYFLPDLVNLLLLLLLLVNQRKKEEEGEKSYRRSCYSHIRVALNLLANAVTTAIIFLRPVMPWDCSGFCEGTGHWPFVPDQAFSPG